MKTATIEQLSSWSICYNDDQIRTLAGDVTEFTALDVLLCDEDISADDRLWVVLRPELIESHILHEFARDVAEHAHSDDASRTGYSSADWPAVWYAALYAVRDAAKPDIKFAAWRARWVTERAWQVKHLVELLETSAMIVF